MSQLAVNSITDANAGNTATINGMTPTADSLQGFRNRILNGGMVIDQRNAGASVSGNNNYTLDRWQALVSASSKFTVQQNAGSVTPPAGFTNYLGVTSSSAYSVGSGDYFTINQRIEGFNVADLGWGTANAKTVTLSFWVRSSLTGTFGGSFRNSASNRSYPYTYTISVADTWEYKTITIAGDTSGTWLATNGIGIDINFSLGAGAAFSGTASAWAGTNYFSATGATSVVGTNGATWYITGVQLEVGSVATPFERRPYGLELSLCQRYFYMLCDGNSQTISIGSYYNSTLIATTVQLPVEMRTAPSLYQVSGTDYFKIFRDGSVDDFNSFTGLVRGSTRAVSLDSSGDGASGTAGQSGPMTTNNAAARLGFSAEL